MRGKPLTCREGLSKSDGLRPLIQVGDQRREISVPASRRLAAHQSGKAIAKASGSDSLFRIVTCVPARLRQHGNNIFASSAEPSCLFVIPGSCDSVETDLLGIPITGHYLIVRWDHSFAVNAKRKISDSCSPLLSPPSKLCVRCKFGVMKKMLLQDQQTLAYAINFPR